jgi:hypothetical protein
MKKEMKRLFFVYLDRRYAVNTVKMFEFGKIVYDLITIVDVETNKLSFTNQKLDPVILDTRDKNPTLITSLLEHLPGELTAAIKNAILNEYVGRVTEPMRR